jgi:hypothetical protein
MIKEFGDSERDSILMSLDFLKCAKLLHDYGYEIGTWGVRANPDAWYEEIQNMFDGVMSTVVGDNFEINQTDYEKTEEKGYNLDFGPDEVDTYEILINPPFVTKYLDHCRENGKDIDTTLENFINGMADCSGWTSDCEQFEALITKNKDEFILVTTNDFNFFNSDFVERLLEVVERFKELNKIIEKEDKVCCQ